MRLHEVTCLSRRQPIKPSSRAAVYTSKPPPSQADTRLWTHGNSRLLAAAESFAGKTLTSRLSRRNCCPTDLDPDGTSPISQAPGTLMAVILTLSMSCRAASGTAMSTCCTGTKHLWSKQGEVRHNVIGLAHDPRQQTRTDMIMVIVRDLWFSSWAKNRSSHSSGCGPCLRMISFDVLYRGIA
jgi:hypothetical protein